MAWRAIDVSTSGGWIAAATVHPWQLRWYVSLLGGPKSFRGSASVTKGGVKLAVTARWPREREDKILRESRWLESVLGCAVRGWRELVDAINWRWVLKKVEELVDELKPLMGSKKMDNAEREWLARRMLSELALLAHFAEARRGMDADKWREERIKRLAEAVEALSNGRIGGDNADSLALTIIRYAEGYKKETEERIKNIAEKVGLSREELWGVVKRVFSGENPYAYYLARYCAWDAVVRKFVEPALELIMLDKALNNEFDREEARLRFGEMYATAVAGDGTVGRRRVGLTVGGELGGGAALLRLATLHLFNQLLSNELKFNMQVYVERGVYYIAAYGENAAGLMRLLAVSAPSASGWYLSPKFKKFVEEARVEVQVDNIRLTKGGGAADLTISETGVAIKYNVYLSKAILLNFESTDRGRAELAARLLKLAGVDAEVKRKGDEDIWRVIAYTDVLAAGRKELRKALAEIVRKAIAGGWVDARKAEGWLEKLKGGVTLREGWPKYEVGLSGSGTLVVRFGSTNPDSIARERQRFRAMGLKEGRHFSVKMPEEGRNGYVYIRREGLVYAAWLSVHGSGRQRELAAEFIRHILDRAREEGEDVRRKAEEVVEESKGLSNTK